jgi:hypothetical protein
MLKCDYCGRENTPCSTYNPDHKFECAFCRCDRLSIYDSLSKEKIIEKLIVAHRELHCMSENSKSVWAMLDVEKQTTKVMKEWLTRWLQYGENTFCESEILLTETKKLLKD